MSWLQERHGINVEETGKPVTSSSSFVQTKNHFTLTSLVFFFKLIHLLKLCKTEALWKVKKINKIKTVFVKTSWMLSVILLLIVRNTYLVFVPFLSQSSENPWNSLSDKSVKDVLIFIANPFQPHLSFTLIR